MACVSCLFSGIIFTTVLLIVVVKLYIKLTTRWCTNKLCLVGKTIIVTGANTGIGYETALELAKRGARVILGCRDQARAIKARDEIIRETRNENVIVKLIDFSSLESVRNFAKDVNENEAKLDVLVNNAAIAMATDELTKDGLQLLPQVNYFGPFLLTILLIDKLKKSAPSRIINVSSLAATYAKLDVDNINTDSGPFYSYFNSKLCNILFTMHLAKILEKQNVTVYSLHPGTVSTEISRTMRGLWKISTLVFRFWFKSSEEGAQTTIYTATQQGIEQFSGRHFDECRVVKTYDKASDPQLPKRLWNKTVELLKYEEKVKNL